jgi:hypothetical protein
MAKRRAGSRIPGSPPVLTLDQKKSGIDPIYLAAGNVPHIVGKLSTRATTLLETALRSEVCRRSYAPSKSRESLLARFRDSPAGVPGEKSHLDASPVERHRVYYKGEGGGFPKSRPWQVPTPKGVPNVKLTSCGWFLDAKGEGGGFPKSGPW